MKTIFKLMLLVGLLVAFNTEARRISDDSKVQTISTLSMEVDARIQAIKAFEFVKLMLPQCGTWYQNGEGTYSQSCSDQNYSLSITRKAFMMNGVPVVYEQTNCYQSGYCWTIYP